jgi:hypothetical protein
LKQNTVSTLRERSPFARAQARRARRRLNAIVDGGMRRDEIDDSPEHRLNLPQC